MQPNWLRMCVGSNLMNQCSRIDSEGVGTIPMNNAPGIDSACVSTANLKNQCTRIDSKRVGTNLMNQCSRIDSECVSVQI